MKNYGFKADQPDWIDKTLDWLENLPGSLFWIVIAVFVAIIVNGLI